MSKRRVGGSGWAGVYGSFVGLAKGKPGSKLSFRPKKKAQKVKPQKKAAKILPPILAIDLAALPDDEGIKTAAKRAMLIHADLEKARTRVTALESQLSMAMEKFKVAQDAVKTVRRIPRISLTRKDASPK